MEKKYITAGVIGLVVIVVIILAISIPLSKPRGNESAAASSGNCQSGWTGQFCDEAICSPMCTMHGMCVNPNNCSCDFGWTGSTCDHAECTMPCTENGDCTSPNTCTCRPGWTGFTCEMPTSAGFRPSMTYRYKVSSLFKMSEENIMVTNMTQTRLYDSNVTVRMVIKAYDNGNATVTGTIVIDDVSCNTSYTKESSDSLNLIPSCPENITDTLARINISFCQNSNTGKITHVSYQQTDEETAMFIASIVEFLDYETSADPAESQTFTRFEKSPDGKQRKVTWNKMKNSNGADCYNFKRTMNDGAMVKDVETKQVCMSPDTHGAPSDVMMMQAFKIGEHLKGFEQIHNIPPRSMDVAPIPSFIGTVEAYGKLMSIKSMTPRESEYGYYHLRSWLTAGDVLTVSMEGIVFQKRVKRKTKSESEKMHELLSVTKHKTTHKRLSTLLKLIHKDESIIRTIGNILATSVSKENTRVDRSLLISSLGASQILYGQQCLVDILSKNETVPGDHILAMGSVAQIKQPVHNIYMAVKDYLDSENESLRNRALLVFGVLGSRGRTKETSDILRSMLISSKTTSETIKIITAMGNLHSVIIKDIVTPFTRDKKEIIKRAALRALRHVDDVEINHVILNVLRLTRSKLTALECLNTLKYKTISQTLAMKLTQMANQSQDIDILKSIQSVFQYCKTHEDILTKSVCDSGFKSIPCIIASQKHNIGATWSNEYRVGTQNIGVYYGGSVYTENSGNLEKDLNIKTFLDGDVFGTRFRLVEAASETAFVNPNDFITMIHVTLTLFNREYDLFMKTWRSSLPFGVISGDPCLPTNGEPIFTVDEYFHFDDIKFKYGTSYVASFDLELVIAGTVKFGYGLNIITDPNKFNPKQINVIAEPVANIGASLNGGVSVMLVSGGVDGEIGMVEGTLSGQLAVNLKEPSFCYSLSTSISFLAGKLYAFVKIDFAFWSKRWNFDIFDWKGSISKSVLKKTTCCKENQLFDSFKIPSVKVIDHQVSTHKDVELTHLSFQVPNFIKSYFTWSQDVYWCLNKDDNRCPTVKNKDLMKFVRFLTVPESIAAYLTLKVIYHIDAFVPVAETVYGDTFVADTMGRIFKLTEPRGILPIPKSSNLDLFVFSEIEMTEHVYSMEKVMATCQLKIPEFRFQMPILNLRSYCSRMQKVCNIISNGIQDHGDVLTYIQNADLRDKNIQLSCKEYVKCDKIVMPYMCSEYPFAFTLEGGVGATVGKILSRENYVRQEAVNEFIRKYGLSGGEKFKVVL